VSPTVFILLGLSFCLNSTADVPSAGPLEEKAVKGFLDRPTQQTFLAISRKNDAIVRKEMTTDGPGLDRLCDHVSKGNPWAIRYLLQNLHACDGAALESALIALGQLGDRDPEQLLNLVRQRMMTSKDLTDAVGTRPITFVDNDLGTIRFFEARQKKLERVSRTDLLTLKAQALQGVANALKEFRSH
jgi:hypothetical protein